MDVQYTYTIIHHDVVAYIITCFRLRSRKLEGNIHKKESRITIMPVVNSLLFRRY